MRCEECLKYEAVKTDGEGRDVCGHCALGLPDPFVFPLPRVGRNENCPCGSGRKYKHCCQQPQRILS
jgi:uncharacterized protein YecA (UPF0149 family)